MENQGSCKTNRNQIDKARRQIEPHRVGQNLIQDMKNQMLTETDEVNEHRETAVLKTRKRDISIQYIEKPDTRKAIVGETDRIKDKANLNKKPMLT